jgi:hypothetical protein
MRHALIIAVAAMLALVLTGSVATAEKQLTVKEPVTIEATPVDFETFGALQSCQVGNLNAAAWAISSFLSPPEDYKLAFDPLTTCTICPMGIAINKVHAYLQTKTACTLVMSVDVEEAVYPTPGCTAPGPVMCSTQLYTVNLTAAGLWNVGIPITCPCLTVNKKYLLSVHFQSMTCTIANIALITDAGPGMLCYNWNDYGTGWYDLLVAFPTWPGQLKFFADAECCSPPVPVEGKSWGAIKELYKN